VSWILKKENDNCKVLKKRNAVWKAEDAAGRISPKNCSEKIIGETEQDIDKLSLVK